VRFTHPGTPPARQRLAAWDNVDADKSADTGHLPRYTLYALLDQHTPSVPKPGWGMQPPNHALVVLPASEHVPGSSTESSRTFWSLAATYTGRQTKDCPADSAGAF
jgi:hypothetical protein